MGLTGLGKVFAQVIHQIGTVVRYIGTKISHYIKLGIHYLFEYVKAFWKYVGRLYGTFQRDPIRFMQFAGSLAIMTYYGVL